jgi:hypothetical protein
LISRRYKSDHGPFSACLHLHYFLSDRCTDCDLTIDSQTNHISQPLLKISSGLFDSTTHFGWLTYRQTITVTNEMQLSILAKSVEGAIAIRDLYLHAGHCSESHLHEMFCTFEDRSCDFAPNLLDRPRFKVIAASTLGISDHSRDDPEGHLLALYRGSMALKELSFEHISEVTFYLTPGQYLLSFWTNGFCKALLEVYMGEADSESPILTIHNSVPDPSWQSHYVVVHVPDNRGVVFRVTLNEFDKDSYFALDDVRFEPNRDLDYLCDVDSQCYWQSLHSLSSFVDLEHQVQTFDTLDHFKIHSGFLFGPTPFVPTDHTLQDSNGLFLWLSGGRSGALRSHSIDLTDVMTKQKIGKRELRMCLDFWYFWPTKSTLQLVSSSDRLRLRVLIGSTDRLDLHEQKRLTFQNLLRGQWQQVKVDLLVANLLHVEQVNVYITVDSVPLPNSTESDAIHFALDDLVVTNGPCLDDSKWVLCDPNYSYGQRILPSQVCDFVVDCKDGQDELNCGDCTFNDNLCGYRNAIGRSYSYEWTVGSHNTNEWPIQIDQKSFAYVKGQPQSLVDKDKYAVLESPALHNSHGTCDMQIKFASTCAELSVTAKPFDHAAFQLMRFEKLQPAFAIVRLNIGRINEGFRLQISSRPPSMGTCDVVIGQIGLDQCARPKPNPLSTQCSDPSQHRCDNGFCIPPSQVCDHVNDCNDESDEQHCDYDRLACTFESGGCEWFATENTKSEVTLRWQQGQSDLRLGPGRDHTHNRKHGHFLQLSFDRATGDSTIGSMQAGPLYVQDGCEMRLFVMCKQCHVALQVLWFDANGPRPFTEHIQIVDSEFNWSRLVFPLFDRTAGLASIALHARISQIALFVAIDDISFTRQCYTSDIGSIDCEFGQADSTMCGWTVPRPTLLLPVTSFRNLRFTYADQVDDVNSDLARLQRRTTRVLSPISWVPPRSLLFVRLWYRMTDVHQRKLSVLNEFEAHRVVWTNDQVTNQRWQLACIPFATSETGAVRLAVEVEMQFPLASVSLSSISVNEVPCDNQICTFDDATHCAFIVESFDGWTLRSQSFHENTLIRDHTTGTIYGGVAMIASGSAKFESMRLLSSIDWYPQCISFWFGAFSVTDADVKSLKSVEIRLETPLNGSVRTLFNAEVISSNEWYQALVSITSEFSSESRQLNLIGRIDGEANRHFLAVDDLTVRAGSCDVVTCDFDKMHSCDWQSQTRPDSSTSFTGWAVTMVEELQLIAADQMPAQDVSTRSKSGGVLYTYFSRRLPSYNSVLISSMLNVADGGQCLTFMHWTSSTARISLQVWTSNQNVAKLQKRVNLDSNAKREWGVTMVHLEKLDDLQGQTIKFVAQNLEFNAPHDESMNVLHNALLIDLIMLSPVGCPETGREAGTMSKVTDSPIQPVFPNAPIVPIVPDVPEEPYIPNKPYTPDASNLANNPPLKNSTNLQKENITRVTDKGKK